MSRAASHSIARCRRWCACLALAAGSCGFAQPVVEAAETGGSQEFKATLTTPILYSSAIVRSADDELLDDAPDWHADPELTISWTRQFERFKLSAEGGALIERYATIEEANFDTLLAKAKAEFTDGASARFVPYVEHEIELGHTPFFSREEERLYNLSLGFTSGWGFDRGWRSIPFDDVGGAGTSSIEVDFKVARRFAHPEGLERVSAELLLTFTHVLSDAWELSVEPELKGLLYDNYFGEERADLRFGAIATLTWTPEWLAERFPELAIDFSLAWEQNVSTLKRQSYELWEVGPTVNLTYEF